MCFLTDHAVVISKYHIPLTSFQLSVYFMFPMLNTALKKRKFQDTKDNKNS